MRLPKRETGEGQQDTIVPSGGFTGAELAGHHGIACWTALKPSCRKEAAR